MSWNRSVLLGSDGIMFIETVFPELPPMLLGAVGLLFTNLAAIGMIQAYSRRPLLAVGSLCVLAWTTGSGFTVTVGQIAGEYLWGRPQLVDTDLLPDPHTRLEKRGPTFGCCICDPRWDEWNNGTLRLLTGLFGAGPTAYDGPYPSPDEARQLLALGAAPTVDGERLWVGGQSYPIRATSLEERDRAQRLWDRVGREHGLSDWGLTDWNIEAGLVKRAVPLRDDAVLVDTGESLQVRIWDREGEGRVWVAY
ncbi:MAG: hypothetical protein ACI8S6_005343 [Myxococcota bacterium]|jgi:hypothetical protein